MINLANIDQTQREISRHLAETERLLRQAVTLVSGRDQPVELWLMPDLGMPQSIRRMAGGFYTGMLAKWECSEPFVPIDMTVNVCAVGVYRVKAGPDTQAEWFARVETVRQGTARACSYKWNFDSGNHFITLAEVGPGQSVEPGRYLVLHSSAAEFKCQSNGLYPSPGNWYSDRVEVVEDRATGRRLRYIRGMPAERFYRQARLLVDYNRNRLHYFAEQIMGCRSVEEVSYSPHYGMPDSQSVAIGCQWVPSGRQCMLLTAPGKPLFMVEAETAGANRMNIDGQTHVLMPHGLGVVARGELRVDYRQDGLLINGQHYCEAGSLKGSSAFVIRGANDGIDSLVRKVLELCPGRVSAQLQPLFSYPTNK